MCLCHLVALFPLSHSRVLGEVGRNSLSLILALRLPPPPRGILCRRGSQGFKDARWLEKHVSTPGVN